MTDEWDPTAIRSPTEPTTVSVDPGENMERVWSGALDTAALVEPINQEIN